MIRAVLFDLDDTLYDQSQWLAFAWRAVAEAAAAFGVDAGELERALTLVAAEGSDRGHIIDRALHGVGAPQIPVAPLVNAFRSCTPPRLSLYPGAGRALRALRREVPTGLVTDGDAVIQQAKLQALGLAEAFDAVIFSDTLGRERRKPHPAPFEAALAALGVRARDAVYIGDRPEKDVRGAAGIGMRPVRVLTGEWMTQPDELIPWATAPNVVEAIGLVLPLCGRSLG